MIGDQRARHDVREGRTVARCLGTRARNVAVAFATVLFFVPFGARASEVSPRPTWGEADMGGGATLVHGLRDRQLAMKDGDGDAGVFGLAAGVNLSVVALGVRGSITATEKYALVDVGPIARLRFPLGQPDLALYTGVRIAYVAPILAVTDGTVSGVTNDNLSVHGISNNVLLGLGYWSAGAMTAGIETEAGVLAMFRDRISSSDPGGTGYGVNLRLALRLGFQAL